MQWLGWDVKMEASVGELRRVCKNGHRSMMLDIFQQLPSSSPQPLLTSEVSESKLLLSGSNSILVQNTATSSWVELQKPIWSDWLQSTSSVVWGTAGVGCRKLHWPSVSWQWAVVKVSRTLNIYIQYIDSRKWLANQPPISSKQNVMEVNLVPNMARSYF